jgi:hypothetical protein
LVAASAFPMIAGTPMTTVAEIAPYFIKSRRLMVLSLRDVITVLLIAV